MDISNSNATFIDNVENDEEVYDGPVFLVFNPAMARPLIKKGFALADIKPNKNNRSQVVFVFKDSLEFRNAYGKVNKARRQARIERRKNAEEVVEKPQQED